MKINLKNYVENVEDFPKKGILFKDITPVLLNKDALKYCIKEMSKIAKKMNTEIICAPESRGFIFGMPTAYEINCGFIPIRKPNKLPRKSISYNYSLEYGTNTLCMHEDAIKKGQKVLIVDDLLATGGTIDASIKLIEKLGGIVVACVFLIELKDLNGRKTIGEYPVYSLLKY